jgi:hypothetical protein
MKIKIFKGPAPVFRALQALAMVIQTGTLQEILAAINAAEQGREWAPSYRRMLQALRGVAVSLTPHSAVFAEKGNSKLPFVAFSTLPGVTCPGAGECLQFCYSYSAWRHAEPFGRQAQNALLMRFNPEAVALALRRIAIKRQFIAGFHVRVNVDGDFATVEDVGFWVDRAHELPHAQLYCYSKSFSELLAYAGEWPQNLVLNLSSGHSHGAETVAAVERLPITRGWFIAVNLGRRVKQAEHGTPVINRALLGAFGAKAFTCPGKCGACTKGVHACGSMRFQGVPILVAGH